MALVVGNVERGVGKVDEEEYEKLKETIKSLEKDLAVEKQMVKDESETHRKVGLCFARKQSVEKSNHHTYTIGSACGSGDSENGRANGKSGKGCKRVARKSRASRDTAKKLNQQVK